MNKRILALASSVAMLAGYCAGANAVLITIEDFTGDDAEMLVEISNAASGVTATWAFTGGSASLGDITGVWLGIIDSLFDPSTIQVSDVTVSGLPSGVTYSVTIGDGIENLGNGVNLTGAANHALLFDFDLGLKQNDAPPGNEIVANLFVSIVTAGLLESMFDGAGARIQSSTGSAGSSKLAGGVRTVKVPEPGGLSLLGAGLLLLGFAVRLGRARGAARG